MKRALASIPLSVVEEVYKEHQGDWKAIMEDERIKLMNQSQENIQDQLSRALLPFRDTFLKSCADGDVETLKNNVDDWRTDLSFKASLFFLIL